MWLGNDDTMQGWDGPEGTDGQLYQWVEGIDGLGNAVGCWQRVRGQAPQAPYTRGAAPLLGEMAEGPNGNMYQWVQGVDGLGSTFGFWKRIKRLARKAMPLARMAASFVPGGTAALTVASPFLRRVGVAGPDGLGALYEAADGSMYQVQGVGAGDDLDGFGAEELQGLEADDELSGLEADDELDGFGAGDELNGFAAGDELDGFEAGEELSGFAANDQVNGVEGDEQFNGIGTEDTMNGYVPDRGVSGVDAFIPERPRQTPAFSPSPRAPMWAPLW